MIAYNKECLENTFLVEKAINLKNSGFIEDANLNTIKSNLQTLKTSSNIFVRIGFFILGSFLYSSIFGVLALLLLTNDFNFEKIIGFVYALIGIVILELFCNLMYFKHGLDDAFVIFSQIAFYSFIMIVSDSDNAVAIAMIFLGMAMAIRYISSLSFIVSLSGFVFLIGNLLLTYTTISAILPFVLFLIAIGFYVIYQKIKDEAQLFLYQDVLTWFYVFSLILGYLSINYFVVRSLSEELLNQDYTHSEMPFGWIFYVLMFLLPIVYVVYSLKTHNRLLLYIGAITFGLSIATYKFYHNLMPAEWALILSGTLIFLAVYVIIQKINNKETGITFEPDTATNREMLNNLEALIVNAQNVHQTEMPKQSEIPFGGGGFSGGGAGESF